MSSELSSQKSAEPCRVCNILRSGHIIGEVLQLSTSRTSQVIFGRYSVVAKLPGSSSAGTPSEIDLSIFKAAPRKRGERFAVEANF